MSSKEFSFDSLPAECVAIVLSKCSPRDFGRSACVSRTWLQASQNELVWNRLLKLSDSFGEHFSEIQGCSSGSRVFHALRKGAYSRSREEGCSEYLLTIDLDTGLLSVHVSAFRCLYFYIRNDTSHTMEHLWVTPYGLWPSSVAGSTFEHAAPLAAGHFHIHAELYPEFPLPAGDYSLSFRIGTPPPLKKDAAFAAVCIATVPGEVEPFINKKINLHRDGVASQKFPEKVSAEDDRIRQQEAQPPDICKTREEPEAQMPWHNLNRSILKAASFLGASWDDGDGNEYQCGRVKPWKQTKHAVFWQEFQAGKMRLRDEGRGVSSFALDLVLTDVECHTFKGAIWVDSLILTQMSS